MEDKQLKEIVDGIVKRYQKDSISKASKAVNLATALQLCEAVKAEAKRIGVNAVVCVSDRGGHPILVECMDDAYIASYDVAVNKAYTVVALKMSTATLKPLAQPGAELYGIQFTNGGRIVVFGGGDPLLGDNGEIIGGLGVSGGSEAEDTTLSAFGKTYFETKI